VQRARKILNERGRRSTIAEQWGRSGATTPGPGQAGQVTDPALWTQLGECRSMSTWPRVIHLLAERPESGSGHLFLIANGPNPGQPLTAAELGITVRCIDWRKL
jgi:hypothetical protein